MSGARTAWLFPGHGSQHPGMGRETLERSAAARQVFAEAEALCGRALREVMLHGPAERLGRPALLEPALAALALSHAAFLAERGQAPDCVAGYSAGEVAALYVAGVVSREGALRLAALRAEVLEEAAAGPPARMAALHGIPAVAVEAIVEDLAPCGLIGVAGRNAADPPTVVGTPELVVEAERRARALGAAAAVVEVAGPWHSPAATGAAAQAWERSHGIDFAVPRLPLFMGASGLREADPERIRMLVALQICRPVFWRRVTEGLLRAGCSRFLELGPGGVLATLLRRRVEGPPLEVGCVERRGGGLSRRDWLGAAPAVAAVAGG